MATIVVGNRNRPTNSIYACVISFHCPWLSLWCDKCDSGVWLFERPRKSSIVEYWLFKLFEHESESAMACPCSHQMLDGTVFHPWLKSCVQLVNVHHHYHQKKCCLESIWMCTIVQLLLQIRSMYQSHG